MHPLLGLARRYPSASRDPPVLHCRAEFGHQSCFFLDHAVCRFHDVSRSVLVLRGACFLLGRKYCNLNLSAGPDASRRDSWQSHLVVLRFRGSLHRVSEPDLRELVDRSDSEWLGHAVYNCFLQNWDLPDRRGLRFLADGILAGSRYHGERGDLREGMGMRAHIGAYTSGIACGRAGEVEEPTRALYLEWLCGGGASLMIIPTTLRSASGLQKIHNRISAVVMHESSTLTGTKHEHLYGTSGAQP
jgi:hypothetical protein